ncbi:Type 1 glutamine amidotransferase-like domain-containing protein [Actinomadura violacea]|uniref:Type 1 glutamine amidotransferase-like domain-containing protein n=1 Tax=Actinomadura violacea TaxID=2819934 RepID=A0ABS3RJP7_9ACTN|nr:Type 1 glutamine amidotransferase-like domain-containing protein [Actinomadura violacea]MBO2456961.1 Type 1 glutamine amidotransferase-like domain-containing protein [Actinomadura violacea]
MRLYLSSFRVGRHPDRLLGLLPAPKGAEAVVIANALDAHSEDDRRAGVGSEIAALTALGLRPTEIDLRRYFGRPAADVAAELARFPLVWARGGNAFMLRYALARSGADAALTELLERDALVYAGYSAGGCVLAPSLRGLEACDDPSDVARVHGEPPVWEGLGVLDHVLVPHVDSPGHPESEVLTAVAARYRDEGVPHRPLRDGQVLVVDGAESQVH